MRFYIFSSSLVFIWNNKTDSRSPTIFFVEPQLANLCENVLSWPRCSCESFQPRCCRRPPAAGLCCRTGRIIQSDSRWEAASAEGGGRGPPPDNTRAGGRKPTVSFSSRCPWGDWSGRPVRVSRCTEVTARHVTLDLESRLGTSSVQRENGYK